VVLKLSSDMFRDLGQPTFASTSGPGIPTVHLPELGLGSKDPPDRGDGDRHYPGTGQFC
jgi:hypothetical protein